MPLQNPAMWCLGGVVYGDPMAHLHLEILVEPFRENEPGPHVQAVLSALEEAGLQPDMGPFATTVDGDGDVVTGAIAALIRSSVDAGASALQLRVEVRDG